MVRVRTQMKQALGRAKGRMQKAGQSAFRTALPLVATLMASCSAGNQNEEQCDHYNSSTVIINNSESEDGQIASIEELRERDGFISEDLAYAIRITHGLSTQGLPERFQTTFTVNDEECFIDPDTGLTGTAHAITPEHDLLGDWGVYTHLSELTLDDFSLMAHEIGHLQMSCGEICAEVNAAEQMLMLFVAYSNQSDYIGDLTRWAAQATNQLYGLEALHDALRHIYEDNFRLDPDPVVSMSMHPKWKYIRADVFILESFINHAGNFSEIRDEVMSMEREELQAEANERLERFVDRYSVADLQTSLAEIIAQIRMAHYSELHRRFGAETADSYFNSNSLAAFWFPGTRKIIRVDGLEGMNCMIVENAEIISREVCSQDCDGFEAVNALSIEGARLHCFSVENGDFPIFDELDVTANGMRYYGLGGSPITIDGVSYNIVVIFDEIAIELR